MHFRKCNFVAFRNFARDFSLQDDPALQCKQIPGWFEARVTVIVQANIQFIFVFFIAWFHQVS